MTRVYKKNFVLIVLALSACWAFGEVTQSSVDTISSTLGELNSTANSIDSRVSAIYSKQQDIGSDISDTKSSVSTISTDLSTVKSYSYSIKDFVEVIKNKITESFTFSEGAMRILNNNGEITNNSWETKTYDSLALVFKEILTFQARNLKQLGMMSYNELNHYNTSIKPIYENIKTNNIAGNVQYIADYLRTNNATANSGGADMGIVSNVYDIISDSVTGDTRSIFHDTYNVVKDVETDLFEISEDVRDISANSAVLTNEFRGFHDSFSRVVDSSSTLTNEFRGFHDSFSQYLNIYTNNFMSRFFGGSGTLYLDRSNGFNIMKSDGGIENLGSSLFSVSSLSDYLIKDFELKSFGFAGLNNYWYYYTQYYMTNNIPTYLRNIDLSSAILTNEFRGFHDSFSQYLNIYTNNFLARFFGDSDTPYQLNSYKSYYSADDSGGYEYNWPIVMSPSSLSEYLRLGFELQGKSYASLNNYAYNEMRYFQTNNIPTYLREIDAYLQTNRFGNSAIDDLALIYTNDVLRKILMPAYWSDDEFEVPRFNFYGFDGLGSYPFSLNGSSTLYYSNDIYGYAQLFTQFFPRSQASINNWLNEFYQNGIKVKNPEDFDLTIDGLVVTNNLTLSVTNHLTITNTTDIAAITNSIDRLYVASTNHFSLFGEFTEFFHSDGNPLQDFEPSENNSYHSFLTNLYVSTAHNNGSSSNTHTSWFDRVEILLAALVFSDDNSSSNGFNNASAVSQADQITQQIDGLLDNNDMSSSVDNLDKVNRSLLSSIDAFSDKLKQATSPTTFELFVYDDDTLGGTTKFQFKTSFVNSKQKSFFDICRSITTLIWCIGGLIILWRFVMWSIKSMARLSRWCLSWIEAIT